MRFSERYRYKPIREIIQRESIDQNLKTELWNSYLVTIEVAGKFDSNFFPSTSNYNLYPLYKAYWGYLFKKPIDEIPNTVSDCKNIVRDYFFEKLDWFEVYDFIEITLAYLPSALPKKYKVAFTTLINKALERENSAYRIINDQIIEITSAQEIQSIEEALENTSIYSGLQQHLNQALKLMSDRQNPDYRNSIKESISAVESICKVVTNDEKATLGKALKLLKINLAYILR